MTRFRSSSLSAMLMMSSVLVPVAAMAQDDSDGLNGGHLGAIVLQEINIVGAGTSAIDAANTAGSRVPVDPQALPRAVTILPRELFEAQGARTMEETVAYSPGIVTETYGQDNRYDEYILRGFEAQIGGAYRDAMPLRTVDWASWRTEPFGLDSVNILRGPTSDLYGTNQPGGLINGVSKRPSFSFGGEVRTTLTSDSGREIAVDVTGPLSDSVAYRLIGLWNKSGTNYDAVDTGRAYFAPSLTFASSDQTTFTVYGQYQKDNVGDTYVIVPQYGSRDPNSKASFGPGTYTGNPDYNTIETTQNYLGYELEHGFGNGLTFTSRARVSKNDWLNKTEFPAGFVNLSYVLRAPAGLPTDVDTAIMTAFDIDQSVKQNSFDNALRFAFDQNGIVGDVAVGVDHYTISSDTEFAYGYRGERNLLTGAITNYLAGTVPARLPAQRSTELRQTGLYANGHAEFGDRLVASGSLRHDWVKFETNGFTTGLTGTQRFDHKLDQGVTSANLGLGYRVTPAVMAYGSLSRSFNLPPSGMTADGSGLDLETARSLELGLKYQSLDGRSSVGLATYSITKKDVAVDDPISGDPMVFAQIGKVRSRGVELEATHDFNNGLSLFGSLNYVDAKVGSGSAFAGNQTARAPKFSAAFFAQYEVPSVEGLAFSVGARHMGKRYADISNTLEMKAVTLYDASVKYNVNDWEMSLAVRNLTDEQFIGYCSSSFLPLGSPALNSAAGSCVYGAGREVSLSLNRTF